MTHEKNQSTSPDYSEFGEASRAAAKLGGEVLVKWLGKTSPQEKGFRDWVTQADLESQQVIRDFLAKRFPKHCFIGEESIGPHPSDSSSSEFCWIVDPLDGTTNYVHQLRSFAVSVALYQNQRPLAGAVYDPILDECFSAVKNHGAQLNGQPIETSGCDQLATSLMVFSFGRGVKRDDIQVTRFLNVLENAGSVRRLGSAALNLCYVGCGRTDGYWATSLSQWDVAAGWLIALEAGAKLADFTGAELDLENPHFCVTASEALFIQLQPLLNI
jgi:myo-inositol-1(or 4)-monophosphatase